ncbi:MAG: DNA translocase FtsK 4TM domain-containing protein [Alphaproteobacteria bacterium]|nr:DNA translocase FtsK 4TM domain-containing protein [Alphaproteobacteria bacterium]
MARRRSIRRARPPARKRMRRAAPRRQSWWERTQIFIARRFVDALALMLIATGCALVLALLSYSSADPSWNTAAASTTVANWMGSAGAWVADALIQFLGASSFFLAAVMMFWGVRIYQRADMGRLSLRILALVTSLLALSSALALLPDYGWASAPALGGVSGTLLFTAAQSSIEGFFPAFPTAGIVAFFSVMAFGAGLYALSISTVEILQVGYFCVALVVYALQWAWDRVSAFYDWVRMHNPREERPVRIRQMPRLWAPPFAERAEDEDETEEDSDEDEGIEEDDEEAIEDEEDSEEDSDAEERSRRIKTKSFLAARIPVVKHDRGKKAKSGAQQRLALGHEEWELPALDLLQDPPHDDRLPHMNEAALQKNAALLQNVLSDFGVSGDIVSIYPGPVVTLYELEPSPGTKTSRVISLSDDIARSMATISVRCAVVPGRNVIGIELPNKERQIVYMQELLASHLYEKTSAKLPLILGKDIAGQPMLADLAKMPHLLVAGTTGSGKSVAVNTMILSLLYRLSPAECRFIMIDPKMLELSVYDDIPHLLAPVVTEPGKAVVALKWTVQEMENRYRSMSKLGVRNIEGYNARIKDAIKKGETIVQKVQTGFDLENGEAVFEDRELELVELPYIVVVVDEFADLMLVAGKDVENAIQRLAQMARAAGIHLIMATQRPSVDVITGVIKANFPTRISFQVTSKIDSRTILGEGGAEQLLGMGDMLYMAPGGRITRVHGPFVSDKDVENVVNNLRAQATPAYLDSITEETDFGDSEVMGALFGGDDEAGEAVDPLYDQAVAIVVREGKASTSFVQRHLQIGYNRAARIIEEMERQGVISKANAVGKRQILVRDYSDA